MKEFLRDVKDKMAAENPDSDFAKIRAIEWAAKNAFPDDADMDQRFDLRNKLRAEQGLGAEKRKRGGFASAYDRGFLTPALAIALGPLALGLAGGGAAGGAGAAGGTAAGTAGTAGTVGTAGTMGAMPLSQVANAGIVGSGAGGAAGGAGLSLGGLASSAGSWLKDPKNLLKLGSGIQGVMSQQKGNDLAEQAMAADQARWAAGAPLREAGMAGLMKPMPVDTGSLAGLQGTGNPFSRQRQPMPPMPLGGGR